MNPKNSSPLALISKVRESVVQQEKRILELETALAIEAQKRRQLQKYVSSQSRVSRMALLELLADPKSGTPLDMIDQVKMIVSDETGVDYRAFNQRTRPLSPDAWAKQLAMDLCFKFNLDSQTEIERRFGCKSHGTIAHARNVVESEIARPGEHRNHHIRCSERIRRLRSERESAAGGGAG